MTHRSMTRSLGPVTLVLLGLVGLGVVGGQPASRGGRHWHQVAVTRFKEFAETVGAAHVCTQGTVLAVTKEADGDYHIRLGPNVPNAVRRSFVVLEIIPELPLPLPQVQKVILACGVIRYDPKHGWWELHPLLKWEHP